MSAVPENEGRPLVLERYDSSRKAEWDQFVRGAKNGTFLFERDYMDYHADRFADRSLMLMDGGRLLAVLPAHERGAELVSHGGLTYGGFVSSSRMTLGIMRRAFESLLSHLRENNLQSLSYKTIPNIYHREPAQEDLHELYRRGATLTRRDVLAVIDQTQRGPLQERRQRAVKKASKEGLEVRTSEDYASYWAILTANLRERYGCDPVHSLAEIVLLASRFPEQIRLVSCYSAETMMAGVVAFLSPRVVHLQYIGSTEEARARGGLDLVIQTLIEEYADRRFFDFGAATEDEGRYVNAGLMEFKEGFGARSVVHDFYTLSV